MCWVVAVVADGVSGGVGCGPRRAERGGGEGAGSLYECSFPDGLRVVEATPLATGVASRPVETASGTQLIEMDAAEQVTFGYPLTDFFANAKVELLPAARYPAMKRILLANLAFLESERNGPTAARALPVGLHGFEVHGNDLRKLAGNMLGMYVLFDDKAHVATTIYFLNQQAWAAEVSDDGCSMGGCGISFCGIIRGVCG